jgi:cell wall-associated NlpC family hydrolase
MRLKSFSVTGSIAAIVIALAFSAAPARAEARAPARAAASAAAIAGAREASYYGGSAAGNRALDWAERYALGHWYCWAGAGPSCYDCSGLVMAAFGHADGIWLPHSTYLMPGSPRLHWIPLSQARRGDILFYGPGHVEFDTVWYHVSFGAHDSGSRVGWIRWGWGWYPTAAYRVY